MIILIIPSSELANASSLRGHLRDHHRDHHMDHLRDHHRDHLLVSLCFAGERKII